MKVEWLDEREQRAWRAFMALHTYLPAALNRRLQRDTGLSMADYHILVALSESPQGRLRAYEIAHATMWEKSRLSHHLSRMEQRGLVSRAPCPADQRYPDVVLTTAGRAAIGEAAPRHVADVRRWFVEALSPEQLDALTGIVAAIMDRLGQDTPAG
ncbi:MAG TPA: MarR family winged helix-turn-helix transcriptional regulator [Rugosimonospora sp.]|nr:MarR family winged helix-turn-helix transcriptional regulator [Rugosimonospora sp.]